MDAPETSLSLLNVFDVVNDEAHHHLICFLDAVLAGSRGIDPRSIVGEFTPKADQQFDPESFVLNTLFLEALTAYMNEETAASPAMAGEASRNASGRLYLIDPRHKHAEGAEPSPTDVLGAFSVDEAGKVVPGSFEYNEHHLWFDEDAGVSGVLSDRAFYNWLHRLS
jgi:hypothetical protein